jgi:hypothetical protein
MLLSRKVDLKTKMKKSSDASNRITASCKRGGTVGGVAVNDRREGWSHEKVERFRSRRATAASAPRPWRISLVSLEGD